MVTRMENFGAVDEEPTTSLEMEVETTVTVESVVETVMETVADAVVETVADAVDEAATGAHSIQGDTWLLNLTSLAEGLQGVNLTDGVNLQGWVLNITALVEDVPLSEYFPILSLKEYAQWLITLVVIAFSTQWIIIRIQKWMCVRGRYVDARSPLRGFTKKKSASRASGRERRLFRLFINRADLLSFFSRREQKTSCLFAGARNAGGTTPCSSPSTRV